MKRRTHPPVYITLKGGRNKDFHIRVIEEERLIPTVQSRDADFAEEMRDYGSAEDLPDSDRLMICQQKGIRQDNCEL